MPATPEILNRKSFIRAVKVNWQPNVKEESSTYSHVTVTAKIKVQLKGVAKRH